MSVIRVVVVDDSPTMRMLISSLLESEGDIEVVGAAPNPEAAREMIRQLNPDVVTLDVEMPGMSGIEFLEKIMRLRPMPVVMISTLTQKGADTSIEAMRLGAVGCFGKPVAGRADAFQAEGDKLLAMVREASTANVRQLVRRAAEAQAQAAASFQWNGRILAIGASTGGVEALFTVLAQFPANCPPTLIVQHMPPAFTGSFARRLDAAVAATVVEAKDGDLLEAGKIYIAPGGDSHLHLSADNGGCVRLTPGFLVNGHSPSVDELFNSVAKVAGQQVTAALLTGMGVDGAAGLQRIKAAGGETIAQDEATSVVFGMPKAAIQMGAAQRVLPLERIGPALLSSCRLAAAA